MAASVSGTSELKSEASQQKCPEKWLKVGVVQKLYIYPVEGSHPKEIVTGLCTPRGLAEPEDQTKETFLDR